MLYGKIGPELADITTVLVEDVEERVLPGRVFHQHDQPAVLHQGEVLISRLIAWILDKFEDIPDLVLGTGTTGPIHKRSGYRGGEIGFVAVPDLDGIVGSPDGFRFTTFGGIDLDGIVLRISEINRIVRGHQMPRSRPVGYPAEDSGGEFRHRRRVSPGRRLHGRVLGNKLGHKLELVVAESVNDLEGHPRFTFQGDITAGYVTALSADIKVLEDIGDEDLPQEISAPVKKGFSL